MIIIALFIDLPPDLLLDQEHIHKALAHLRIEGLLQATKQPYVLLPVVS